MTTIRAIMIMTIISSFAYNTAQAMEKAYCLLSIDLVPIEFFTVHNKQEFNQLVSYGNGIHPNFSPLYWYRVPTHFTITPADEQTITLAETQRNFIATKKINSIILEELGYSPEELQKYAIRAENSFKERLQAAMHLKNI
jgi:hypothetical protein